MRWMTAMLLLLCLAACGGGNNATSSSGSSSKCGDSSKCSDSGKCGDSEKVSGPEAARDGYIAAFQNMDAAAMKRWLTKAELEKSGDRMEKDFAKMKDEVESFQCDKIDWKEEGAYWVYTYKLTVKLKDGKDDVDPEKTIYVIKEGDDWRVQRRKPE